MGAQYKPSVYRPATIHSIKHCDPKRLEDVFPLAITFGCEPKETTVVKIKNYISKYYPSIDVEKKLQPALDKGVEAGVFEKISPIKYRLHADEFDPYKKESVQECITSAIIASTEPKVSSIRSIKKYIQEYHHEFNLDYKPALLTNALERASNKHILKHISGIGASGSVQLLLPFIPSPGILAGDEDEVEVSSEYIAKPSRSRSSPMAKVEEFHTVRSPPRDRSKVVKPKTSPNHDKKKEINGGVVKKKTKGKMGKAKTAAVKKDARKDDVKSDMKDDAKKEEIVEVSKIQQKKLKGNNRSSKVNNSKTDIDPPVQEENPPVKAAKRTRLTPKAKPSTMRERSSRGRSSVSYREDESEVDENSEDEDKEPAAKKSRRKK